MAFWHKHSYWLIPVGIALVLNAVVGIGLAGDMPLAGDALDYHREALSLLHGTAATRHFYYPPGTTFLLYACYAGLSENIWAARLVMLLLTVVTVAMVCQLCRELFDSTRSARIAGYIAAIYPPVVMLAGLPYSQNLAHVCVLGTAYFWLQALRRRHLLLFAAAGAVLGMGCITRPSMLGLGLVLALSGLYAFKLSSAQWRPHLVAGAGVCLVCWSGVVLPVMRHNAEAGAGWVISTNNEGNLFKGNNPYTPHYKTSLFAQRDMDTMPLAVQEYVRQYRGNPDRRKLELRAALRYIREHPGIFFLRTVNRIRAFWGFDYLASRQIQQGNGLGLVGLLILTAIEAGGYAAVMVLAILGLLGGHRSFDRFKLHLMLGFILAYQLPYCLAFSSGTYHFPVMGLILTLSALGLQELQRRWQSGLGVLFKWPVKVYVALAAFAVIQIEYAYFTWIFF